MIGSITTRKFGKVFSVTLRRKLSRIIQSIRYDEHNDVFIFTPEGAEMTYTLTAESILVSFSGEADPDDARLSIGLQSGAHLPSINQDLPEDNDFAISFIMGEHMLQQEILEEYAMSIGLNSANYYHAVVIPPLQYDTGRTSMKAVQGSYHPQTEVSDTPARLNISLGASSYFLVSVANPLQDDTVFFSSKLQSAAYTLVSVSTGLQQEDGTTNSKLQSAVYTEIIKLSDQFDTGAITIGQQSGLYEHISFGPGLDQEDFGFNVAFADGNYEEVPFDHIAFSIGVDSSTKHLAHYVFLDEEIYQALATYEEGDIVYFNGWFRATGHVSPFEDPSNFPSLWEAWSDKGMLVDEGSQTAGVTNAFYIFGSVDGGFHPEDFGTSAVFIGGSHLELYFEVCPITMALTRGKHRSGFESYEEIENCSQSIQAATGSTYFLVYVPEEQEEDCGISCGLVESLYEASSDTPAGFVFMWSGTIANIPAGFSRVTELDDKYVICANEDDETNDDLPSTTILGGLLRTGGAATHVLTLSQFPSHTHVDPGHGHNSNLRGSGTGSDSTSGQADTTTSTDTSSTYISNAIVLNAAPTLNSNGSDGAHQNLHPYKAVVFVTNDEDISWDDLPAGIMTFWNDSIAAISAGWQHADGTGGTPDMRDVSPVGASADESSLAKTNISGSLTVTGGAATVTLDTSTMPAHGHSTAGGHLHNAPWRGSSSGGQTTVGGAVAASVDASSTRVTFTSQSTSVNVNNTGGGGAHENMPPYFALPVVIKL